jgi:outer membrane biogenesis lipoprotein LolB
MDSRVKRRLIRAASFLCAGFILSGCAWLIKPPQDHGDARAIVERYSHLNADLRQFKGLGHLQMLSKAQTLSGRVAWAAALPDKLRVEWLNALGQPLMSLAGDGDTIAIVHIDEAKVHYLRQSDTALEPLVHIPMGIKDFLVLLAGRPPLPAHAAAQMSDEKGAPDVVTLKNRWSDTVAEIQLDDSHRQIKSLIVYARDKAVRYRIHWEQWQNIQEHALPRKVMIEAGTGERIVLTLDRYWLCVELPDSTFVLTLPEKDQ